MSSSRSSFLLHSQTIMDKWLKRPVSATPNSSSSSSSSDENFPFYSCICSVGSCSFRDLINLVLRGLFQNDSDSCRKTTNWLLESTQWKFKLGWKHIWEVLFSISVEFWLLFVWRIKQTADVTSIFSSGFFKSRSAVSAAMCDITASSSSSSHRLPSSTHTLTNPLHVCADELISLSFPPLVHIFSLLASRCCRRILQSWSI